MIVDVNGVGYDAVIPVSAYSSLPEKGSQVQLHIHTHVREDALALFGFVSHLDKLLFEKLITVSGIDRSSRLRRWIPVGDRTWRQPFGPGSIWCEFPGSGRRQPSAWCRNCATSWICRRLRGPYCNSAEERVQRHRGRRHFGADEFWRDSRGGGGCAYEGAVGKRVK